MQDLQVIDKLNGEAVERSVPSILAKGKHAVVRYTGLNVHSVSEHDTAAEALEAAGAHIDETPGNRAHVRSPEAVAA